MIPDLFENFGQSLVATVFFSNNILLWLTSGYFALESEFKPLLHTWTLGVEEQYYIIIPLVIMATFHLKKKWLLTSFLAMAVCSLIYAEISLRTAPDAAFYLLPARGWELLLGSLLALSQYAFPLAVKKLQVGSVAQAGGLLGLALVLISTFYYDKNTPYPGLHALMPTTGALLIILCASNKTIVGKFLSIKPLVKIGLISYSAYLWHQPVFAFARLRSLSEPGRIEFTVLTALSLGLAFLSWKYIELPFRNRAIVSRRFLYIIVSVVGLTISGTGYFIYVNSGFVNSYAELGSSEKAAGRRLNAVYNEGPYRFQKDSFASIEKQHLLVVGNSFARDFINSGLENGYFSNYEIAYATQMPHCLKGAQDLPEKLRTLIGTAKELVISSTDYRASGALDCWESDFAIFRQLGVSNILVMGTKNFGWNMNAVMLLPEREKYSYRAPVLKEVIEENQWLASVLPADDFVNILSMIMDENKRVAVFTPNHRLISQDRVHLTRDGARTVGEIIFNHPLLSHFK
jgi:peptidoglycan/LPS O-acetylase OafA/YrhL